jgi:hypothetical protein
MLPVLATHLIWLSLCDTYKKSTNEDNPIMITLAYPLIYIAFVIHAGLPCVRETRTTITSVTDGK